MAKSTERGFTIIEVVLFLAITGGLFAALMLGVNSGITQQRYLDSVRSYKALLQNQYSEVLNTRNGNVDQKCSLANDGTIDSTGPLLTKGTSKCVILGRAIRIENGNNVVTSSVTGYDVVGQDSDNNGTDDSTQVATSDDVTALKLYRFKVADFDKESVELDWGSYLTPLPTISGSPESTAVILILRSPATGLIRILTSPKSLSNYNDLSGAVDRGDLSITRKLENCIKGDSGLLPKQSITIDPSIASPDAVMTTDSNSGDCR
jgi:type II secretory pathway pseudopilin PulG